jgi:hypothetical protein
MRTWRSALMPNNTALQKANRCEGSGMTGLGLLFALAPDLNEHSSPQFPMRQIRKNLQD